MGKKSAGILLYRFLNDKLQVLLVHPGGPYYKNKDDGAWSIPKGEFDEGEEPLDAAIRELKEELGSVELEVFTELTPIKQKGGKTVFAWACQSDFDTTMINSNLFEMEWPPKSGKRQQFPEVDRAEWFDIDASKAKINAKQFALIEELATLLEEEK